MRNGMISASESIYNLETDNSKSVDEIASSICNIYISSMQKDNYLKEKYAKYLIWILIVQLALINIIFIAIGRGILIYDNFTINLYVTGSILEITTLITIIVKYLFSNKKQNVDNMVRDYITNNLLKGY